MKGRGLLTGTLLFLWSPAPRVPSRPLSSHLLAVEHDGGEDDDGHGEREDEEAQLGGARLQRVAEDAQPLRVARKFEDAEHAEHAEGDERPGHLMEGWWV